MDLRDDSSDEDEELPPGRAPGTAHSGASARQEAAEPVPAHTAVQGQEEISKSKGGDKGVGGGGALAAAIAAAGAMGMTQAATQIDYVAAAADRPALARAEASIKGNQFNTQAWETLCGEAQALPLERARPLYERFLAQFPTAGRFWKYYAEHVYRDGNVAATEEILERGLKSTVNCELWRFYTKFKVETTRSSMEEAAGDAAAESTEGLATGVPAAAADPMKPAHDAFARALDEVGASIDSGDIWHDYLNFLKNLPTKSIYEKGQITLKIRDTYQRVIKQPIQRVAMLWREYEEFERGIVDSSNEQLSQRLLKEHEPAAKNAIAMAKERTDLYKNISFNMLPVPEQPENSIIGRRQVRQLALWRQVIAWEKDQSATQNILEIRLRVRHTYKQALCCLRYFPDFWYDFALEELAAKDTAAATAILNGATRVLPRSLALNLARASLHERLKQTELAETVYEQLIKANPCALVYIQYQRFVRRSKGEKGIKAARAIFARARKAGDSVCNWQLFLAAALLEFYANKNAEVAGKIFELGLKRFPTNVEYARHYVRFLAGRNEEAGLRVLFQRIIDAVDDKQALRPLWNEYLAFENSMAVNGGDVAASELLERRYCERYAESAPRGLAAVSYRLGFLGLMPEGVSDTAFLRRVQRQCAGMSSGPITFASVGSAVVEGSAHGDRLNAAGGGAAVTPGATDILRKPSKSRGASRSRSQQRGHKKRDRSSSRSVTKSEAPMVIMPGFLAPLLAELPTDDQSTYWPTREQDVMLLISSLRNTAMPPPPPKESSGREHGRSQSRSRSRASASQGRNDGDQRGKRKRDASGDSNTPRVTDSNKRPANDIFQRHRMRRQMT